MAQRISSMPYSQEGFVLSSAERGLGAMLPQNQGMTNRDDMGTGALADVNGQSQRQYDHALQGVRMGTMSARPQAVVNETNKLKKGAVEMSTAQQFLVRKLTDNEYNVLERAGGSNALMELSATMQDPIGAQQFAQNIRTQGVIGDLLAGSNNIA